MGLLAFMKDVGEKLSGGLKPEKIEEKLKEDLKDQLIEIHAEVEGTQITLSGLCKSEAAKEKAVLIAGNLKGVGSISYYNLKVQKPTQVEKAEPTPSEQQPTGTPVEAKQTESEATEFYTIVSGDTLSKIAKKYYGDANKYPVIFKANLEVIKDPDKIFVGQTIRIPKLA